MPRLAANLLLSSYLTAREGERESGNVELWRKDIVVGQLMIHEVIERGAK